MKTAVCTFGFGRPDHFKRMLQGLAVCPEVMNGEVDLHHYLDGGEHSLQAELVKVINDSGVPYQKIIQRAENFGVGRQLIVVRQEIFDEQKYEWMVQVEDEIEAGPTFMTALLRPSDWAENYEGVGTVQVWNIQSGTKQELEGNLSLSQAGLHRLTTEVSHALYFGETGVHRTPEVDRQGMQQKRRLLHHQEQDGEPWADFYEGALSLRTTLLNSISPIRSRAN